MRILVCASEAPLPPYNGLRLQLAALTGALAAGHEVCVLAFRWPGQTGAPPPGVELIDVPTPATGTLPRAVGWARALVRREPVESVKLVPPMRRAVAELLGRRRFDVVHVSIGMLAPIAPALRDTPAVIAPLDAWHLNVAAHRAVAHGPARLALAVHERFVRRFVATAYRPYAAGVFVTDEDARASTERDPTLRTMVAPNGVDVDAYHPAPAGGRDPGLIVFTGALGAPSNVAAATRLARRILPRVRETHPAARLALVGREPSAEVRALAEIDGVEVTGAVEDLRTWLWRAEAYVCPMESGTGIKNKLLEAMACGAPCVATPLACQGLAAPLPALAPLVAGDDEGLAAATRRLLDDARLRERAGRDARDHVVAHHGWDAVADAHVALYRELAGAPAAS